MNFCKLILSLFWLIPALAWAAAPMHPPTKEESTVLKKMDLQYQKAKSISMDMQKTTSGELIPEKKSTGTILISKGRMRMEIAPPNQALIVINKKEIWIANSPPAEFKDAAVQVAKLKADSKSAQSQNFLGLLMGGGFSKYFKIVSVQAQVGESQAEQASMKAELKFFLSPLKSSFDVTRAELLLSQDQKSVKELIYWDERNNETHFEFSHVTFGPKVSDEKFKYTPPKNAEVSVM
jgi:outer membrane lipoprotein-sorting protein